MTQVPDFDALYRADPDPWSVASSFYEQRKLAVLLACLTRATYASAWDPASGTGELAARLVERADTVLATDSSVEAVQMTARRCRDLPGVEVRQLRQPAAPTQSGQHFALVVLAEFAYYLPEVDRQQMWDVVSDATLPSAEVVVVHWRHRPHDGYLSGADVQREAVQRLAARSRWQTAVHHEDEDFVLDVLRRESS